MPPAHIFIVIACLSPGHWPWFIKF